MGEIKVPDNDGKEKIIIVSDDVEAQVLATLQLAKATGRAGSKPR